MRQDKTEKQSEAKTIDWGPLRDLSLKQGETLSIKIPTKSKHAASAATAQSATREMKDLSLGQRFLSNIVKKCCGLCSPSLLLPVLLKLSLTLAPSHYLCLAISI